MASPTFIPHLTPATQFAGRRVGIPFPPDNRTRVTQTTQRPWSATGLVSAKCGAKILESTGFAIGDRHVVTAAHSVLDVKTGIEATAVTFDPARNAAQRPYGNRVVSSWQFPDEFRVGYADMYDYCLLTLKEPLPLDVFRYELVAASDHDLESGVFQIAGYPSDKLPE
jgi:V8-like Glu-specific endopeptidase